MSKAKTAQAGAGVQNTAEEDVIDSGMILPFEQLSLTFSHVSYYVSLPKVTLHPAPCWWTVVSPPYKFSTSVSISKAQVI